MNNYEYEGVIENGCRIFKGMGDGFVRIGGVLLSFEKLGKVF